jgi:hypothetical protein
MNQNFAELTASASRGETDKIARTPGSCTRRSAGQSVKENLGWAKAQKRCFDLF